MNFIEVLTQVRRQFGIITLSKGDIEWLCRKIIKENKEVFEALA